MFALNQLSFKTKYQLEFDEGHVDEDTYITNLLSVSILGITLGFISMRRVTGSLKAVLALWLQFPPLLLLPMFGFVTFGPTPQGETYCMEPISRRTKLGKHFSLSRRSLLFAKS